MNATEMMAVLNNQYLWFTEEDLDMHEEFNLKKMKNPKSSIANKQKATLDLQDIYQVRQVFAAIHELGLDTSGETAASILKKMSGRTVGELKSNLGTTAVLTARQGLGKFISMFR